MQFIHSLSCYVLKCCVPMSQKVNFGTPDDPVLFKSYKYDISVLMNICRIRAAINQPPTSWKQLERDRKMCGLVIVKSEIRLQKMRKAYVKKNQ